MSCKGICCRYKAKSAGLHQYRYANGQKRCNECEIFVQWDGFSCPCCGKLLRTRPRSVKAEIYTKKSCG
jgi:hypothetical protein